MVSRQSRRCAAICVVVLFVIAVRPAQAQEPPEPQVTLAPIDYLTLNQPGPLWLVGADLSGQDLYGVDLAGAVLRQANFDGATLAQADLSEALLVLATLRNADLTQADLRDATLTLADLRFANLADADLSGAQIAGTVLSGARLDGAQLTGVDLRQSDMTRTSLRSANLSQTLLSGANLHAADLTDVDLSQADLSSANLAEAKLAGANLDGVLYDKVTVWPANFDVKTMAVTGPLPAGEPAGQARGSAPGQPGDQALSITLTLMPQLQPWFNQAARPEDGSLVERAQQVALLDQMTVGSKMVVFKSVDMAEQVVPHIADKFDTIGYNLEHGPLNPLHEQADPVGSVVRMRALANEYGLRLALGLDHTFALSHGVAMAPYVDSYAMQVQRVQSQPAVAREFIVPMAEAVRAANPAIETTIQVRTEGEAEEIAALIDSVRESINGVVILSSRETTETAMQLVALLRQGEGRSRQAPVTLADSPPAAESTAWSFFLNVVPKVLVAGLALLFFYLAGRALLSHRRAARSRFNG